MTKQEALAYFGGCRQLAAALDIWPSQVYGWKSVPIARQYQIEVVTEGKLKAERKKGEKG